MEETPQVISLKYMYKLKKLYQYLLHLKINVTENALSYKRFSAKLFFFKDVSLPQSVILTRNQYSSNNFRLCINIIYNYKSVLHNRSNL